MEQDEKILQGEAGTTEVVMKGLQHGGVRTCISTTKLMNE